MSDFHQLEDAAKGAAQTAKSTLEAYQHKVLQIAQENIQFSFEFGQALAAVRSPADFMNVTHDYTQRRMDLFQKHTRELTELSAKPFT